MMAAMQTLSRYPLFFGELGEDVDLFLADFWMVLHINRIHDVGEGLGMFSVVLHKDAHMWFWSLPIVTQGNLYMVIEAFQTQYGQALKSQKLWKDINLLKQRGIDHYLSYIDESSQSYGLCGYKVYKTLGMGLSF